MGKLCLYMCFGLLVVALSCTKEVGRFSLVEEEREEFELTIRVTTGQTKVTDTSPEDSIKSVQVFIFADNVLEAVAYSESDNVTLRCFSGDKEIYAVVNHAQLEWTLDMDASTLLNTTIMLSEEGAWNVMFGSTTIYAMPEMADGPMEMLVKRCAARIYLDTVKNATSGDNEMPVEIRRVFIADVVGIATLSGAVSLDVLDDYDLWYNKMGNDGDLPSLLYSEEMTEILEPGESVKVGQYFYCFPNPVKDDVDFSKAGQAMYFSPRYTRLVVEAYGDYLDYGKRTMYYPIPIGNIKSGYSYEVSRLDITKCGAIDAEGSGWLD